MPLKGRIQIIYTRIKRIPVVVSMIAVLAIIYELGFYWYPGETLFFQNIYFVTLFIGIFSITGRYIFKKIRPKINILPVDLFFFGSSFLLIFFHFELTGSHFPSFVSAVIWLRLSVIFIFLRELASLKINFKWAIVNPAQLFIVSFLFLVITGSFFLLLPNATYTSISFTDAIFTSASAVCVTGLTVVDTGSFFTPFGQLVILLLIQSGGLGIMTFTSYFGYYFKGSSSFKKQLVLSELTWSGKLGEVFFTLKKIIVITLLIEITGAAFVYLSLGSEIFPDRSDRIFFSTFHSVSAFCNAGFSTLQDNLYSYGYRTNYYLHITIAILIIFGGIGFPIVFNLLKYLKNKLISCFLCLFGRKTGHSPWILNINTRIVLVTSLILVATGMLQFFIFEYNNTLAEHGLWGKIVTSFFGAVTPRTAGFNTVDTGRLSIPVVFMLLFLMWVGASPASTGGGIKTSTLALAILNFVSMAKGKKRIEAFGREISQASVNRAFSVVFLSLLVISFSVFSVVLFDGDKELLDISFECVSAFSTVGLSRGITSDLSSFSKLVLVVTMFIGRVGTLTVLIALFKKVARHKYQYPSEDVLIH